MPERVIVVGAGLSGLSAAHTIYLNGGNVLLLDKNSEFGRFCETTQTPC